MRWLHPDFPFRPARLPFFYGWVVVAVSTFGVVMSIPGQTMGVSVFTDHLIAATGLSRLELSNSYLVGTLLSSLLLPRGGVWLDRHGARVTALAAVTLLAATLVALAHSDRLAARLASLLGAGPEATAPALVVLAIGFASLRFSGQGMLTMTSRTMMGRWFDSWRGRAASFSGVVVSFGFAAAPLLLNAWIAAAGWRGAWLQMAVVVALVMGGVGWLLFRDNPEECGLTMDGRPSEQGSGEADRLEASREPDFTRSEALRTRAFWLVTLALGNQSLVMTALTFHIVDLGDQAGLAASQAVALFLPIAVVSTGVGFTAGFAAERVPPQALVVVMMGCEILAFLGIAHMDQLPARWLGIVGWGAAGGFFGPLAVVALPRFFGRAHLGAISSAQMTCMVVASAIGPSLLAASKQLFGSYQPALYACCALPAAVLALASVTRHPELPTRAAPTSR